MGVTLESKFVLPSEIALTDRELMRELGLLAREAILRRTAQGLDVDGSPFHAYSAGYAKAKQQAVGGGGAVDLRLSGGMLNALTIVDLTGDSVTLGFSS